MKKVIPLLLILIITVYNTFSYAVNETNVNDSLELSAESAILINAETGEVLYSKNPYKKMFPASTTKILTAIIAIENSSLSEKVIIDNETINGIDGSHIALEPGEVLSMKDLLYALMIESANDAAVAIARHISGSVENFSKLMNEKAAKIGAKDSNFLNPNGLPNENHTTTVYDLAMIGKYAMENETFRKIVSNYTYTIEPTNKKSDPRIMNSSNKLLYSQSKIDVDGVSVPIKYDGINGVKTGYTKVAQQCLVSSVNRDNQKYISVVLHSIGSNVYVDTHKLFNYGFTSYKPTKIASKNEFVDNISIKNGSSPFITSVFANDLYATVPIGKNLNIEKEFTPIKDIKPPISKGQVVGKVTFKADNKVIGSMNVISKTDIHNSVSIIQKSLDFLFSKWWFWLICSFIFLRLYVGILRVSRRMKKLKRRKLRKKSYNYNRY